MPHSSSLPVIEDRLVPATNRPTSHPPFWNERYIREDALFGIEPNAFIREQSDRIGKSAEVVEVGAGEARNLIFLARTRDACVSAVDFAEDALRIARRRAADRGVELETIAADARAWQPERRWDAVLVTFLHLLPHERPSIYRLLQEALRPGGVLLAEWFSAVHADKSRFAEIGPSKTDRLISADELRQHFLQEGIEMLEETKRTMSEGSLLHGPASVLRLIWQKPER